MSGIYESVYFSGQAHPQTHPDRLATLGTLFGLKPAPPEKCRVLELACGDGLNLVAMAAGLPQSEFLGLDLAEKPLEHGRSAIAALGLKNITLRAQDLLQAPGDLGPFDYIVVHGLYAWVPAEVKDKALALCHASLAPHGIAYFSYNAYPGSHQREMLREMMLFQIRTITEPDRQIEEAMNTLRFLASGFPESHAYGSFLRKELEMIRQRPRDHFFHDDLSDLFAPVYFCEFVAHAQKHGLQFLTEAGAFEQPEPTFLPPVAEHLAKLEREGHVVEREQMLDFLRCQRFRQTLLCRQQVRPNRSLRPTQLAGFRVAGGAAPVSPKPDLASDAPEEFRGPQGLAVSPRQPLAKAALLHLSQIAPRSLPWRELVQAANARLGQDAARMEDTTRLGEFLWKCFTSGLVELRLHEPAFVTEVSARPVASPLVRWQVRRGETATNALHQDVRFREPHVRHLLGLLDGTRDQAALLQGMTQAAPADPSQQKDSIVRALPELQQTLASLARHAVLVA